MTQTPDTTTPTRSRWRLLLLRVLLSGACPPVVSRALHRAVMADPAWRAAYDEHRHVERAASGTALSPGQVNLVEQLLVAALPAEPATRAATTTTTHWLMPAFAGAVAVLAFVVVRPATTPPSSWTARGGTDAPRVGVRARCIEGDAVVSEAEAGPRAPDGRLRCRRGALLSLALTNLESTASHVYVVGVSTGGELRFVAPFDEAASSQAVAAGTVDRPLDVVADTGAFADDEAITLFALFSQQPLQGTAIARTLRDLVGRGVRVQAIDRLPFDALTARIELLP